MPSDTAAARNSQQAASQRSCRISHPTTGTAARRRRVMTFGTLKTRSLMVLPYLIQGLPGKLVPQLVESFHRHRIRRLQFLGEQLEFQSLRRVLHSDAIEDWFRDNVHAIDEIGWEVLQ